jgi:hypothetical protein
MSTVTRSAIVERGPVSLGCGTLILIALIVLFFSNRGSEDGGHLKNGIDQLQRQVRSLQSSVDDQSARLNRIEQSLRQIDNNTRPKLQPEAPAKE